MTLDISLLKELSLAEQMGRISRLWRTVADKELSPLGLTHPRWSALWMLQRLNDNVSQKTLANALEIELASLMRTLSQLEKQGLIVRKSCESDKRVRIVSLTDDGKALMEKVEHRIMQVRRELLAGIDSEELSALTRTMERIAQNAVEKLNKPEDQE